MRSIAMVCLLTGVLGVTVVAQDAEGQAERSLQSAISVERLLICTNVAGREPVGEAEEFVSSVGYLACFSEVYMEGEGQIEHLWYHGDNLIGKAIPLSVKGPRWRTHSRKMIPQSMVGSWRVDVLDPSTGEVIATKAFKVQ